MEFHLEEILMTRPPANRQYAVHARHIDRHHARLVFEPTFEAAAVAYVEDFHPPGVDAEITILVRDVESGHEHCFRVDLETGQTEACG